MRKKIVKNIGMFLFLSFITIVPSIVKASWQSDINTAGGSAGASAGNCTVKSGCVGRVSSSNTIIIGLRVTAVDKSGNRLSGTKSVDYYSSSSRKDVVNGSYTFGYAVGGAKTVTRYVNNDFENNGYKKKVLNNGSVNWTNRGYSPRTLNFDLSWDWNNKNILETNINVATYLRSLAKTNPKTFENTYLSPTGYESGKDYGSSRADQYLIFEPLSAAFVGNSMFVGTGSEIATLVNAAPRATFGFLATEYLSNVLYYSGEFRKKGFYASATTGGGSHSIAEINTPSGGTALGVFNIGELQACEWNNPDHFEDKNGDGKPDSGPNGENCCTDADVIRHFGNSEKVQFAYPICGSCKPTAPTGNTPACGNNAVDHTFRDTATWSCMYLDKDRNQTYKLKNINSYCTVYCREDTTLSLPAAYQGFVNVTTPNHFIWPNGGTYPVKVKGTRSCKIKVDYTKWMKAYKNGNDAKKSELVSDLQKCNNNSVLNTAGFAYKLSPSITLSDYTGYRKGKDEDGSNIASAKLEAQKNVLDLTNYQVQVSGGISGINPSNPQAFAEDLWNKKTFTATVENQYTLPKDLYNYTNKKTGIISYRKPKDTSNYTVRNNVSTGVLAADDSTIGKNKNETTNRVTLSYSKVSGNNNKSHFDNLTKVYTCKYTLKNQISTKPECDYNNKEHFVDTTGGKTPNSGPNNENCCVHFQTLYENTLTEEDAAIKIQELKKKYPICDNPTNGPKCDYRNPSQHIGAPYGTTPGKGPNGENCCDTLKANYTSYGLTTAQFQRLEREYGCKTGTNTCTPIPSVSDKSCCTDPRYKDYPVCKDITTGISVLYREISLAHPFLSEDGKVRTPGANWQSTNNYLANKYITNNRGVKEENIYTQKPMYIIELDNTSIADIRSYNAKHKFDDFDLQCVNGKNCQSRFIEKYLTDTGKTCTTNRGHNISGCNKD